MQRNVLLLFSICIEKVESFKQVVESMKNKEGAKMSIIIQDVTSLMTQIDCLFSIAVFIWPSSSERKRERNHSFSHLP